MSLNSPVVYLWHIFGMICRRKLLRIEKRAQFLRLAWKLQNWILCFPWSSKIILFNRTAVGGKNAQKTVIFNNWSFFGRIDSHQDPSKPEQIGKIYKNLSRNFLREIKPKNMRFNRGWICTLWDPIRAIGSPLSLKLKVRKTHATSAKKRVCPTSKIVHFLYPLWWTSCLYTETVNFNSVFTHIASKLMQFVKTTIILTVLVPKPDVHHKG